MPELLYPPSNDMPELLYPPSNDMPELLYPPSNAGDVTESIEADENSE